MARAYNYGSNRIFDPIPEVTTADEQVPSRQRAVVPTVAPSAGISLLPGLLAQSGGSTSSVPVAASAPVSASLPVAGVIPPGFEAVGTAADGGVMIAPVAATTAEAAPSLGSLLGSGLSSAVTYGVPIAGGISALQHYTKPGSRTGLGMDALRGAAEGAALGSLFGPVGVLAGAGLGTLASMTHNMTASRKGPQQLARDAIRADFQQAGLLDEDFNITLADGTKFNLGRDGSIRLYEVNDAKHPLVSKIVGLANVLGYATTRDRKLGSQIAGMLTNAAMSNARDYLSARDNILAFASQSGLSPDMVEAIIREDVTAGKLDQNTGTAYLAALNSMREGARPQFTNEEALKPVAALGELSGLALNPVGSGKKDRMPVTMPASPAFKPVPPGGASGFASVAPPRPAPRPVLLQPGPTIATRPQNQGSGSFSNLRKPPTPIFKPELAERLMRKSFERRV